MQRCYGRLGKGDTGVFKMSKNIALVPIKSCHDCPNCGYVGFGNSGRYCTETADGALHIKDYRTIKTKGVPKWCPYAK